MRHEGRHENLDANLFASKLIKKLKSSGWLACGAWHHCEHKGTDGTCGMCLYTMADCCRADNIVRDSEEVRRALLGPDQRWSILGQSFGGFCCLHYLSAAPEGETHH